ncbi:hypothetical protein [Paenibacillus silvae]|uniref:hypothetical protein n=1 Tax=Paenibacillus silvae TaxID=1325358 RepID=UPI00142DD95C|nr:hypothetical protein [Paenibacillus silvae]
METILEEVREELKKLEGKVVSNIEVDGWAVVTIDFENGEKLVIEWEDGGLSINGK